MDELLPYQLEGVQFLASRQKAMLLDQQGLGKTPQAIRAADEINAMRVTVVCPPIGRVMWQRAFARWATELHHVQVLSYGEAVGKDARQYAADVLMIDEGQNLKTISTQRTQAVYGYLCRGRDSLIEHAGAVWILSGTLTPNGGYELYTHLRALWPQLITFNGKILAQWEFSERYYVTRVDERTQRTIFLRPRRETIEELRALVRPISLRRLKADVLPQLPPLRMETFVLPASSPAYSKEEARQIARAIDALDKDEGEAGIPLAVIRRMTGEAKIAASIEYIIEVLEGGEPKVVVFAYHRDVIEALAKGLDRYIVGVIWGGQTDKQRQRVIDRFQTEPDARVVIGQITACNAVIDLTAASREVFVEWSFTPGENAQAAERCHRFTTTGSVLASFLSLRGSLDEAMTRVVERKTAAIAALWSGNNVEQPVSRDYHRGVPVVPVAGTEGIDWRV